MGPLKRLIGSFIFIFRYRGGREGARRRKVLKASPKPPQFSSMLPRSFPKVSALPKGSPKLPKASPKPPQSLPRLPQATPEIPQRPPNRNATKCCSTRP